MAFDQLRAFRGLERVRISDDAHPIDERKPERDRATEAVEKWERSENQILARRVEHGAKLRDVANQIAMTQNDAFGIARAAAGEEQDGLGVIPFPRNFEQSNKPARRQEDAPPSTREKSWPSTSGAIHPAARHVSGQGKSVRRLAKGVGGNGDFQTGNLLRALECAPGRS